MSSTRILYFLQAKKKQDGSEHSKSQGNNMRQIIWGRNVIALTPVPSPALAGREASGSGWWNHRGKAVDSEPRHWPISQRSSRAGCARFDRSARTQWRPWTRCEWLRQKEPPPLWESPFRPASNYSSSHPPQAIWFPIVLLTSFLLRCTMQRYRWSHFQRQDLIWLLVCVG